MKRRKVDEDGAMEACDICYQEAETLIGCFKECTIRTCGECMGRQIKIKNIKMFSDQVDNFSITYTCSMCQHKFTYNDCSDEYSRKFTQWVQESPKVVLDLLNKFIGTPSSTQSLPSLLFTNDEENTILTTLFDIYIPPASLLPWPYRLLHPPYRTRSSITIHPPPEPPPDEDPDEDPDDELPEDPDNELPDEDTDGNIT